MNNSFLRPLLSFFPTVFPKTPIDSVGKKRYDEGSVRIRLPDP